MAYGSVLGQSQSVLSPATAIKMGLPSTASADDAFDKLTGSVLQKEMVVGQDIAWEEKIASIDYYNTMFIQRGNEAVWGSYNSSNISYTTDNFSNIHSWHTDVYSILFYFKGKYFAVSTNGKINYSSNLTTWESNTDNLLSQSWSSSTYQYGCAGNEYAYVSIQVGAYTKIYRSSDGLNWELFKELDRATFTYVDSIVAFDGGVALGGGYSSNSSNKAFIVINDNKEIVFRETGQWYNDSLRLYADDINKRILITTNSNAVTSNFWCYEIDAKQLRKIILNNTNPVISPYSELVFINGNYYFVSGPNKRLCTIDKNLTTINQIYQAEDNRFSYDKINGKLILVKQNASIKYGTLTPIIENQLTNIQGAPIQIPSSQILNGVKMATGNYVGTGEVGVSNPNSLTFDFEPKYLMVFGVQNKTFIGGLAGDYYWKQLIFYMDGVESVPVTNKQSGTATLYISKNKNTLSWYSHADAWAQLNASDVTYNYIAFG